MNIIITGVLFCGILVILVLWVFSSRNLTNNRILALSLACVWYILLMNQFNISGYILEIPHFSRTAIMAGFLTMPFLYVYTRNTFYPGIIWKRKDWLLLIPPVFYIIDLLPYFILPGETKAKLMAPIFKDASMRMVVNEGWVTPGWFHFLVLYSVAFYLWISIIRMIIRNQKMEGEQISATNKPLFLMLVMLAVSYGIMIIPGFIGAIFRVSWFNMYFIAISLAIPFLGVAIFLAFSPHVLYGFVYAKMMEIYQGHLEKPGNSSLSAKKLPAPFENNETLTVNGDGIADNDAAEKQMEQILKRLNQYMDEKKPFLKQSLTIHDLSAELGAPVYMLSKVINQKTGINYNKWLNRYRIEHFIELYRIPENQQLTLEGLAQKAGFASRITFIKCFKAEKDETPTQFFKTHL